MKYRAMAKHYIYEMAKQSIPTHESAGIVSGEVRTFTEGQLSKFVRALNEELEAMRVKLVKKGIIVDG